MTKKESMAILLACRKNTIYEFANDGKKMIGQRSCLKYWTRKNDELEGWTAKRKEVLKLVFIK